jgi:hypothetical protein
MQFVLLVVVQQHLVVVVVVVVSLGVGLLRNQVALLAQVLLDLVSMVVTADTVT